MSQKGRVSQSFRPWQRIHHRPEFQRVYEQGRRAHGRFLTMFLLPNTLVESRLGIAATRKIGGAVRRNLAKRWLREAFRRNPPGPGFDVVVVPRPGVFEADYAAIEAEFRALLGRVRRAARASHRGERDLPN